MVRCVPLPIVSCVFVLLILAATYVSLDRWLLSFWSSKTIQVESESVKLQRFSSTQVSVHNLPDDQLFQQVSLSIAPIESSPAVCSLSVNCKLSLLFLTRGPLPLARLWERWLSNQDGLYSIYVHAEPGFKLGSEYPALFQDREIPSQVLRITNKLLDLQSGQFINAKFAEMSPRLFWQIVGSLCFDDSGSEQERRAHRYNFHS